MAFSPLRSGLGCASRSTLGVLESSGADPWNFILNAVAAGQKLYYTNKGTLQPFTVIPNITGATHFPSSNNALNLVIQDATHNIIGCVDGWYDFNAPTLATASGVYTGTGLSQTITFASVVANGTTYVLYGTGGGSGPNFYLGTTTDGKTITPIPGSNPIPLVVGYGNASNAVSRLYYDGNFISFCACYTTTSGGFTRPIWRMTNNFGSSWINSTQNLTNAFIDFSAAWVDVAHGTQYVYFNNNLIRKSNDYFRTNISSVSTTNLGNTGTYFSVSVPMADGIRIYLAATTSQARVITLDGVTPDIVLMGGGNGRFPCIDSDRSTVYAYYNNGLQSSTDFVNWTQLTNDPIYAFGQPTFKSSQCLN